MLALRRALEDGQLTFVFVEMEDVVISTLKIQKLVPPTLAIMSLEDVSTTSVGHITPVTSMIEDMSITFGASSLTAHPASIKRKRTLPTVKIL